MPAVSVPIVNVPVALTNSTVEKMSRHEMLEWVNSTVHGQYKQIEELCSGIAYCQMMELLFPQSISLKKVKMAAKFEHEFVHNLKLFQAAFTRINYDKSVPIERLIKGRFQDNFEFLQWFKKFFDVQAAGKKNMKVPEALAAAEKNAPRPVRKRAQPLEANTNNNNNNNNNNKTTASAKQTLTTPKQQCSTPTQLEHAVSPTSLHVLQETHDLLVQQTQAMQDERGYYYKKLIKIEALLKEAVEQQVDTDWCKHALAILYATDDTVSCNDSTDLGLETAEL